ncbi:MAG: porin [Comamonas sp.]
MFFTEEVRKRFHMATACTALMGLHGLSHADSVTISGIVDAGIRYDSGAINGSYTRLESGQMIASRLTFSGEESLGSGWKAGFVLESGFSPDTGLGHANPPGPGTPSHFLSFGRTAAVALGNDRSGYLSIGRQYTPLWAATGSPTADPFAAAWLGGVNTLYSTTVRASNSIAYTYGYGSHALLRPAPAQGLGLAAMYGLPEYGIHAPNQSGQQLGFNASYGAGSFWIAYGFHQIKGSNASINASVPENNFPVVRQQTLAASYQLSNTRFFIGMNTGKSYAHTANALKRRNWYVGLTHTITPQHLVRLMYGTTDDQSTSNSDYRSFQIGYQYHLSKRSMLYTAWGVIDNNDFSNKTFSASAGTYVKGSAPKSFIAGVRHNF